MSAGSKGQKNEKDYKKQEGYVGPCESHLGFY
jgi:hypothetical protein